MFEDIPEGKTHYEGDNCGIPEHNCEHQWTKPKKNVWLCSKCRLMTNYPPDYSPNYSPKVNEKLDNDWQELEKLYFEWNEWEKLEKLYFCDYKDIDEFMEDARVIVNSLLKSEKEKWQKERSGWNELKQCPQCYTMKVFTSEKCYRCLEANETKKGLIKKIKNEFMNGELRESFEKHFEKDNMTADGEYLDRKSTTNRSGALAYLGDIQVYLHKLSKDL